MKQLKYVVMAATLALLAACGQMTPQANLNEEIAVLDDAAAAGDGVSTTTQGGKTTTTLAFGEVCTGVPTTKDVLVRVTRSGNSNVNTYQNSSRASFTHSALTDSRLTT
ncbi:MAG: hypothetical protein M3498_06985, partial [Deinococcota bacterium]|nr:hypothetical protein [Deinococcota bacterium]